MNFALLSDDPACLPLLWAIAQSPEDQLVAAACDDEIWWGVAALSPGTERVADWQQLILQPDIDVIIVAGISATVLEAARRIAASERKSLLVIYSDARQEATFAYALWPLEEEGRARLLPALSLRLDPRWRALRSRLENSGRGSIRHIRLQRDVPSPDRLLTSSDADRLLLADADLLRWLIGPYSHVTCLTSGKTDAGVTSVTVTLSGDKLPEAEWTARAIEGERSCRIEIVTDRETIREEFDAAPPRGGFDDERPPDEQPGQGSLLLDEIHRRRDGTGVGAAWSDVVRAFDVVDAARRSLRRRRTVEIGSEEISERRQFKAHMAAGGCGVLMFTLFAVIGALLFGAVADPRDAAQKRSAAAGLIVQETEFEPRSPQLTPAGETHVAAMPNRLWQTTAEVLVERSAAADAELDESRRRSVVETLTAHGARDVDSRTVLWTLSGLWFETAMIWVWIAAFTPLAILLTLQILILLARPAESATDLRRSAVQSPASS